MFKISTDEIQKRYALGERNFRQAELRGAKLSYAILRGVDLSDSDLSESILYGANLNETNWSRVQLFEADLTRAKLNEARLNGTYLTGCRLNEVDLIGACLQGAHLNGAALKRANLNGANLSEAYLTGANLCGADLCGANLCDAHLTGANLSGAYYGDNTQFNAGFDPIDAGMQKLEITTIEELLSRFNYLYQLSNNYLGGKLTANYLESSRPDFDWLNKFQINRSEGITFSGVLTPVNTLQLKWCQEWVNAFIDRCSQIIQDFPNMIDREQLGEHEKPAL